MTPTAAWAFLVLYVLALCFGIWMNNRHPALPPEPSEVPPAEERPAVPPNFKPAKPRPQHRVVTPDRLVRQLHYHDAEIAELRESQEAWHG